MDQLLLTSITIATDRHGLKAWALDEGNCFCICQTLQRLKQRHGVHCDLIADEEQLILDDEKVRPSSALFESLTNVARHAKATHVEIYFERDQDRLLLKIKDDGGELKKVR